MDWLKGSLAAAQKQAQEAAEKARVLAQQASLQARVLAEQASGQAKVLAEQATGHAMVFAEQATVKAKQASEKAKELASAAAEEAQAKLQQLATASTQGSSEIDGAELAKYGVTTGLLETISGMTYSTFSDYPVEQLPSTNPMGLKAPIPGPGFRLTPWQERHALLVLMKGDQLQGLRFALCPKRMGEELFWIIYFTLVKTLLPPEAFRTDAGEGSASLGGSIRGAGSSTELRSGVSGSLAQTPESLSAPGSSKRLSGAATAAATTSSPASGFAAAAAAGAAALSSPASRAAAGSSTPAASGSAAASAKHTSLVGDEAVLVDVGSSSNAGDEGGDGTDEDDDDDDEDGDGGDADLDALEDDPELAAYLQEALDVADGEGGDGEGLSDVGSATDDLDDYINQLDAELGAEGGGSGDGEQVSPAKSQTGT